jgi:hypothetical protein
MMWTGKALFIGVILLVMDPFSTGTRQEALYVI